MAKIVYGSGVDLENAKKSLGSGYQFVDTSKGGNYSAGANDIIVGGSAVTGNVKNSGATHLWGNDRYGTADAISGYAKQQSQNQYQDMINNVAAQQLAQRQAAINQAKNNAINAYQQEIKTADSRYQPLRSQAAVTGAKNQQAINEQLASQGLFNSGDNVSAQLQNRNQTAATIGGLNTQQQGFVNQLQNAIAQVKANAEFESAQAVASSETQRLQSLLEQSNRDREYAFRESQFDYSKERDTIGDQYRDKTFDYQVNRDNVSDDRWLQEFNRQNEQWNKEFNFKQAQANEQRATNASVFSGGSNAQNNRAVSLWDNVNQIIGSQGDQFSGLVDARNYLMANNADIKSAVGTENFNTIRDAIGEALVKQQQKEYGLMKRAQAFGYDYGR